MDFTLTPELKQLQSRVRTLVDDVLQPLELEAEQSQGRLSAEAHTRVKQAVLDAGLNAANIPTEYGGGGLHPTQQIGMHEQPRRPTHRLWGLGWGPPKWRLHRRPPPIERP